MIRPITNLLGFMLPLMALLAFGGLGVMRERTAALTEQNRRLVWHANTAARVANESLERHRATWAWAETRIDPDGARSGPGWLADTPSPQPEGEGAKLLAAGLHDQVIERHSGELSPAGVPIGPVAAYRKVLTAPDTGSAVDAARKLYDLTFAHPSLITPRLLDGAESHLRKMGVWEPPFPSWSERWDALQKLSSVLAELPDGSPSPAAPRIIQVDGEPWWLEVTREGDGCVARPFPLSGWIAETKAAWENLPTGDGIRLSLAAKGGGLGGSNPVSPDWPNASATIREGVVDAFASADPEITSGAIRMRAGLLMCGILLAGAMTAVAWVRQRQALAMQADLARQKDDFLSTVSHELRTPIAAIQLMSENLASGAVSGLENTVRYHHRLLHESKRLASTTAQLLDFALMERGHKTYQFRPLDTQRLAEEAESALSPLASEQGISLDIAAEAVDFGTTGDETALRRMILNLGSNAIKFSPRGTRVSIRMAPTSPGRWMIRVSDQGPGIPPDEQPRVFERFFRGGSVLGRNTPGTGIGLAVARHVAEGHGGTLDLTDSSPSGSTFTCILPNHPPEADTTYENSSDRR